MQLIPFLKLQLQFHGEASERDVAEWLKYAPQELDKQYNLGTAMRKLRLLASMDPDEENDREIMEQDKGRVKRIDGPYAVYKWEPLEKILFSVLREESKAEPKEEPDTLFQLEPLTPYQQLTFQE